MYINPHTRSKELIRLILEAEAYVFRESLPVFYPLPKLEVALYPLAIVKRENRGSQILLGKFEKRSFALALQESLFLFKTHLNCSTLSPIFWNILNFGVDVKAIGGYINTTLAS